MWTVLVIALVIASCDLWLQKLQLSHELVGNKLLISRRQYSTLANSSRENQIRYDSHLAREFIGMCLI